MKEIIQRLLECVIDVGELSIHQKAVSLQKTAISLTLAFENTIGWD